MKSLFSTIMLALLVCLTSGAAMASGAWRVLPDATATTCTGPGDSVCYWVFTAIGDDSTAVKVNRGSHVCFDPDIAGTGGSGTIDVRMAVSAATANGSYVLLGATLTGTHPLACIYDIPQGEIYIDVKTAPGATAAVCVAGPNGRCGEKKR